MRTVQMKFLIVLLLILGALSSKSQTINETEEYIKQNCEIYTKGEAQVHFIEKDGRKFMAYLRFSGPARMGFIYPADKLLDVIIDEHELDCCIILKCRFTDNSEVQCIFIDNNDELIFEDGGIPNITIVKNSKSDNIPNRLKKALLHYAKLNGAEEKSKAF